ncbi:hypothetical protein UK23_43355 [Lentzea aerocolonigenes]|uniref:Uncharacterized protein n=1 Tax=Lentzea aerocolonigenes TaxID=68170 RepID=A0A0F0GIK9_LENAE|nr:hypothetical protein [Lentzea aerocolonigenes]KJK34659.1 hypothetical protein UK23_43355 [Lentzea aerocolonigenes]
MVGKKTAGVLVLAAAALVLGVGTASAAGDDSGQGTRVTGVDNRDAGIEYGTDGKDQSIGTDGKEQSIGTEGTRVTGGVSSQGTRVTSVDSGSLVL